MTREFRRRVRLFVAATALAVCALPTSTEAQTPLKAWDKQFDGASRFKILKDFDDAAVFDKETGLVWERDPVEGDDVDYFAAYARCAFLPVGDRRGWRLPTLEELTSLMSTQANGGIFLPAGHPFIGISSDTEYWTATTDPSVSTQALFVVFGDASLGSELKGTVNDKGSWCVRGSQGFDGQ
jgi:hypothetical protein